MKYRIFNSRLLPYYYKVRKRKKHFERELAELDNLSSIELKIEKANKIAYLASFSPTGYLSSVKLEKVFLDLANDIHVDLPSEFEHNSFLHVLSFPFGEGGLIRAVQSWINRSDERERHSIVFINTYDTNVPQWLRDTVLNHGGSIFQLKNGDVVEKTVELRMLASKYERVILHTFLYEGVAISAFGTCEFKRPVILFNHTDHLFWLGVSVADIVANIRRGNQSDERRGVTNSYFLGVPPRTYVSYSQTKTKNELRKSLGMPEDAFVVLSTGGGNKFNPAAGVMINPILEKIASNDESVFFVIIGPTRESGRWLNSYNKSHGRIDAIGMVTDSDLYQDYLHASDLYLDSYPCGGLTALMDAVHAGLPFVQLRFTRQYNDGVFSSDCACSVNSEKKLFNIVNRAKGDKMFYLFLQRQSMQWFDDYCNQDKWKQRLRELYQICPKVHNPKCTDSINNRVIIDDVTVLNSFIYSESKFDYNNIIIRKFAHYWAKLWR